MLFPTPSPTTPEAEADECKHAEEEHDAERRKKLRRKGGSRPTRSWTVNLCQERHDLLSFPTSFASEASSDEEGEKDTSVLISSDSRMGGINV